MLQSMILSSTLILWLFSMVNVASDSHHTNDASHFPKDVNQELDEGGGHDNDDGGDDKEEYKESGTKFMLDECAAGYMRSRIHGRTVLLRMEAFADQTYDQRMLIYGHSNTERNNVESKQFTLGLPFSLSLRTSHLPRCPTALVV